MTTYEEICKARLASVIDWQKYRHECWEFAHRFVDGLPERLGCSMHLIDTYSLRAERYRLEAQRQLLQTIAREYPKPGQAMELEEDSFWHLGVSIQITGDLTQRYGFGVAFKRIDSRWVMKLDLYGDNGESFEVNGDKPTEAYERIIKAIKYDAELGLRDFVKSGGDFIRHIGFPVPGQDQDTE